jgi:hypothetical protein
MTRNARDERGVIASWFGKIALTTAVLGVVLFDAGAVAVNFFGLDSTAGDVAVAVSNLAKATAGGQVNAVQLEEEARRLAKEADARLVSFEYDAVGDQVFVTIRREANTLIVKRIGAIEDWGKATAEGRASTQ